MTHVTCRLTARNRDQLRNPTLGNRVWATFTFLVHVIWTKPVELCRWSRRVEGERLHRGCASNVWVSCVTAARRQVVTARAAARATRDEVCYQRPRAARRRSRPAADRPPWIAPPTTPARRSVCTKTTGSVRRSLLKYTDNVGVKRFSLVNL